MPEGCERYELRRRDVQKQRALLDGLTGPELAEQRKCLKWAEIDESLELCLSPAAAKLARAQAAAGDHQAEEALLLADQLDHALVDEVRRIRTVPRKSPAPVETDAPAVIRQVRVALAGHRARGHAFDNAWAVTVGQLARGSGSGGGLWRAALQSTIEHWRAAYYGGAEDGAAAVAALEGLDHADQWAETTFEQVA